MLLNILFYMAAKAAMLDSCCQILPIVHLMLNLSQLIFLALTHYLCSSSHGHFQIMSSAVLRRDARLRHMACARELMS